LINIIQRVTDIFILLIITWLVSKKYGSNELNKVFAIYGSLLMAVIFSFLGIYKSWRETSFFSQIRALFFAWFSVLIVFNLIILLLSNKEQLKILFPFGLFNAPEFLYWSVFVFAGLAIERVIAKTVLHSIRKKGYNQRFAVVVGAGNLGIKITGTLKENSWLGIDIKGFFDDDPGKNDTTINGIRVIGKLHDIVPYVKNNKIDMVYIALPSINELSIRNVISELCETTAAVFMVPDVFNITLLKLSLEEIAGLPVINLNETPCCGINDIIKLLEDRILALIILVIILPFMLIIALIVKLTSPGPVIFKQSRYGINGNKIKVLKFRTMTVCEDGTNLRQAGRNDSRVTPFGSFLRRTSLDELPQFFNVLLGNMSIVGPRPHAVAHNELYGKLIKFYMLRHKMKPGITGWAQINGLRGETDTLEKMEKRVEYDLYYINNWSILLDLKIMLITIFKGFTGKNAY
ncbi:MAG: undecaprenyl-phosphate glucose phosphotransferase, partial [Desulfobacterales bacterium]